MNQDIATYKIQIGEIYLGEAVISDAHNLAPLNVIHCLGPVYGMDKPEDKLLADYSRNALRLADEKEIDSKAFPAISTGAFGYPFEAATASALHTVLEVIPLINKVRHIRFVLNDKEDVKVYVEKLRGLNKV